MKYPCKKRIVLFILFFLLLFTKTTASTQLNGTKQFKKIEKILENLSQKGANVAFQASSLTHNTVLWSLNSEKPLIPASNTKLLTSAAAFICMGINYRFKTGIYSDHPLINGVVQGNLYLKGFGDPSLVNEELWILAHEMAIQGLKKINGDIIADETYFDLERCASDCEKRKTSYWYNAETGALSCNFNILSFLIKPGERPGYSAIVHPDLEIPFIRIQNESMTINKNGAGNLDVMRIIDNDGIIMKVKGKIPVDNQPVKINRTITEPALYTAEAFKYFLQKEGITVSGQVIKAETPGNAKLFYLHKSKPLSQIVYDLNKMSNNFIADQILKTMGAEFKGPPGTYEKGITVIKDTLSREGIDLTGLELYDGSGLSSYNRIPARLLCDILLYMARSEKYAPEFISSLAIAGKDGSLRRRREIALIRAKTGHINGVATLSGFLWTEDGEPLIFSMLMNGRQSNLGDFKTSQDKILSILYTVDDLLPDN